jgi:hypothetical protein
MIMEVIADDDVLEFRYESDHVPAIGDRLTYNRAGYRVTDRVWRVETGTVELWTEKE